MIEIQAPHDYSAYTDRKKVFLAGSIEMGKAENWQREICENYLSEFDLVVLNPRRSDWVNEWNTRLDHPNLVEQIQWELQGMEDADLVLMYFSPVTHAPITLLELGLICGSAPEKLVVCCPDGFWRKANVVQTCARYGVGMVDSIEVLGMAAKSILV